MDFRDVRRCVVCLCVDREGYRVDAIGPAAGPAGCQMGIGFSAHGWADQANFAPASRRPDSGRQTLVVRLASGQYASKIAVQLWYVYRRPGGESRLRDSHTHDNRGNRRCNGCDAQPDPDKPLYQVNLQALYVRPGCEVLVCSLQPSEPLPVGLRRDSPLSICSLW